MIDSEECLPRPEGDDRDWIADVGVKVRLWLGLGGLLVSCLMAAGISAWFDLVRAS